MLGHAVVGAILGGWAAGGGDTGAGRTGAGARGGSDGTTFGTADVIAGSSPTC